MSWKSDWLYKLIFIEVEQLWSTAQKQGQGKFGPAPELLYIQQHTAFTENILLCSGAIACLWSYDGVVYQEIPEGRTIIHNQTIQGMFFTHGSVRFHITPDRKTVVWNHFLGPRYGRGKAFDVKGQGRTGRLMQSTTYNEWIS
jgi:hypothetical protein